MLFGDKVKLRAIEPADAELMQRWLNDVEGMVSNQGVPHLLSRKELERMGSGRPAEVQDMAVETTDGRTIGLLLLQGLNWVHRHADLSLLIGEADYRWRGLEEDTVRVACGYCFRVLNLHRVGVALVGENEGLRAVFEACGFKVEGRRENYYWVGDRYLDQVLLRLLAHEHPRR